MSTNSDSMQYESINQADVPKGRDGKHKTIVTAILNDLDLLDPDRALRISLAQLPGSKENIRSALNRATRQHGTEVSISSDSEYFYVWKTTRPFPTIQPDPVTSEQQRKSVRIDKWLWAARFFKTRALASKACDLGRIRSNEVEAKPARDVHIGDMLRVKNEGGEFHIEVLAISDMRGPAAVAQALYRETDESKERRQREAAERKAMQEFAPLPERRPTKRDRRRIIQFRRST